MSRISIGIGVLVATLIALAIFVGIAVSVFADLRSLIGSAGWYGLAAFLVLPLLLVVFGWRDLTR